MHETYMRELKILGLQLDLSQLWAPFGYGKVLANEARSLIEFDRNIVLAQRLHGESESTRNSTIGDLNDMAGKGIPQFLRLDGRVYEFTPTDYKTAKEVVLKPEVNSIYYKVEIDTSDVEAAVERISKAVSSVAGEPGLTANIIAQAEPFTLSCVGQAVAVNPGDKSLDEMAQYHFEQHSFKSASTEEAWKEAYRVAGLRVQLREGRSGDAIKEIVKEELRNAYKPGGVIWSLING